MALKYLWVLQFLSPLCMYVCAHVWVLKCGNQFSSHHLGSWGLNSLRSLRFVASDFTHAASLIALNIYIHIHRWALLSVLIRESFYSGQQLMRDSNWIKMLKSMLILHTCINIVGRHSKVLCIYLLLLSLWVHTCTCTCLHMEVR